MSECTETSTLRGHDCMLVTYGPEVPQPGHALPLAAWCMSLHYAKVVLKCLVCIKLSVLETCQTSSNSKYESGRNVCCVMPLSSSFLILLGFFPLPLPPLFSYTSPYRRPLVARPMNSTVILAALFRILCEYPGI